MLSNVFRLIQSVLFLVFLGNAGCFLSTSIVRLNIEGTTDSSNTENPTSPNPSVEIKPLLVSKVYPTSGSDFLDFIRYSDKALGMFGQADVACTGAEASEMMSCIHAGELLKAELPTEYTSCNGISAVDQLDAFSWICLKDMALNKVFIYSSGFKNGKGLATVIDFSSNSFKKNKIVVSSSGNIIGESESTEWWSSDPGRNPIAVLPNSFGPSSYIISNIDFTNGTILIVPNSNTAFGYNINGDQLAIVTAPSAVLTFQNSFGNNCEIFGGEVDYANYFYGLCSGGQKFNWIEGNFNTAISNSQIPMGSLSLGTGTKHFVIRNYRVTYGGEGDEVNLSSAENVSIYNMKIQNHNGTGVVLGVYNNSRFLHVDGFEASTPRLLDYWAFVDLASGTSGHVLKNIKVSNSQSDGIWLNSNDTVVSNILGFNVRYTLRNEGNRNTIHGLTSLKNSSGGLVIGGGSATVANQIALFHNYTSLNINNTNSNIVSQVALFATTSSDLGISLSDTSNNIFINNMILNDSTSGNRCDVSGTNTDPGMLDFTCGNQGPNSDANWVFYPEYFNLDFILGPASSDASNGTVGLSSPMVYSSISDWLEFSNWFRMWGEGPTPADRQCVPGESCYLWDFRFNSVSSPFKGKSGDGFNLNETFTSGLACPSAVNGSKVLTDLNSMSANTFLVNAIEIGTDGVGDEDGLCETSERCIYMPNFGSYQGEGDYLANGVCIFQDGSVSGVTMYGYPINGGSF